MSEILVAYLEMLQGAISRMSGNSFLAKGWSVTLASAVLGFTVESGNENLLWIGVLAVLVFATLDAYYLALERAFRSLFDTARQDLKSSDPSFSMTPGLSLRMIFGAFFSFAVVMVHVPLLAAFVTCAILV